MGGECGAFEHTGEIVRRRWPQSLQTLDTTGKTCLGQCGRVPLGVLDVVSIVKSRPARARVRSCPHQQTDPLQVALLAELAQRHVSLLLEAFREFGPAPPAIQVRPERGFGAELMEGACERIIGSRVSTLFQKCGDEGTVAGHQDIQERYCPDTCAVLHRQFDELKSVEEQRVAECVVFFALPELVAQEQFNEAVESGRNGDSQRRLSDFFWNGERPAGG